MTTLMAVLRASDEAVVMAGATGVLIQRHSVVERIERPLHLQDKRGACVSEVTARSIA